MAQVDQRIAELARTVIEGYADFLFGAGMSQSAGMKSGREVALGLLRRLYPDPKVVSDDDLRALARASTLEAIAEAVEGQLSGGRKSLAEALREILELDSAKGKSSDAHRDFAALVRLGGPTWVRRVFTTNWDDLLEEAIGEGSAVRVCESNTAAYEDALLTNRIPIVYLHGRLDDEFQVSERDVADTLRLRTVNLILLTRLFEARSFCIVGYSMSDPDLSRIYRRYRDQFQLRGANDKLTYVVTPVSSAAQYDLLDKVWERRQARLIPLSANEFFARLRAAAQTAASARGVKDLLTGYGWSGDELSNKVAEIRDIFDMKEDEDAYELLRFLLRQGAASK